MKPASNFFLQLRRRGVIRAAIAYVVGAWALIEFASILAEAFSAPDFVMPVVIGLLSLGLPAVLAFSWFFDITPDGIRRTRTIDEDAQHPMLDRRVNFIVISLLVAALALSVYGNLRAPSAVPESLSILIADFRNEAGNALFSGIIEESLRVGLEVAPFVSTYPRDRAASIVADIDSSKDGALLLETAGLVALREGVNIVVGGSVRREGGGLVLTASGYAPGEQRELFSVSERAETDADILAAVANVSKKLRRAIGGTTKPAGAGEAESFVVANLEAAAEYLKAQNLQRSRKLEEAVTHYEKAVALDPGFARAYAGLALTEEYLGRSEAASKHWEKALAGLSTLTERGQLRTLGNYYVINQQDYEKALDTYERLVEKYPADNVALNNLAVAAFYAMDFERALEVGREAARRYRDHSAYAANLALYAMYAGRFDEAAGVSRDVIATDPANAYALFVVAQTHAVAGDLAAAESTYEKMTGLDQFARSIGAEGIADLALYRGNVDSALQTLGEAIEYELSIDALNTAALKQVMRADAYLMADDPQQAIAAAGAALEIESNDPAVLVPAARAFIEANEPDRAQAIIDALSQGFSKPRRAYAQALRAQMASARGDVDSAVGAADAAVELADLWLVRLIRANVLLQADRRDEARADLLDCQQRAGEAIAVFYNDRPSLRMLRKLEAALADTGADAVASADVTR